MLNSKLNNSNPSFPGYPKSLCVTNDSDIALDPVLAADGYIYERRDIETYFDKCRCRQLQTLNNDNNDKGEPFKSPTTGEPLEHNILIPSMTYNNDRKKYQELQITLANYKILEEQYDRLRHKFIWVNMDQIILVSLTGKKCCYEVNLAWDIVLDLKRSIQRKEEIPIEQMRLIYSGIQLENDKYLLSYGIQRDSTIHLTLRLRGD